MISWIILDFRLEPMRHRLTDHEEAERERERERERYGKFVWAARRFFVSCQGNLRTSLDPIDGSELRYQGWPCLPQFSDTGCRSMRFVIKNHELGVGNRLRKTRPKVHIEYLGIIDKRGQIKKNGICFNSKAIVRNYSTLKIKVN